VVEFVPRSYQPAGVEHILDVQRCALWWPMGLGKSVVTLTAIGDLTDRMEASRVLIVAPLRVAKLVWSQEAHRWDHLNHLRVQLIRGTPDERRAQIKADADVWCINYENLKWLVQDLGGKWPWDMVVADEASRLKNKQSWRWRALKHVRPRIRRFVELTGTPASAGLMGVWSQIYLLDEGRRLGKTETMYRERWFIQADRDGRQWTPREGALEDITERLRDIVHCIRAEDYMDLPELVVNDVAVELPEHKLKDYRKLEREMFLELTDGAIDSPNAAATTGKCLQYANGAVYYEDDEGDRNWTLIHDYKIQALDSVLAEAEGEPVIVAYNFRCDLERLQTMYPHGELLTDSHSIEDRWNRGEIQLLFAHPKSAGHGLNLQHGGRILCFFGLTWSLEDYEQMIERIGPTRQLQAGTPRTVFVHRLICRSTVDELVTRRLGTRASVQEVLREAMRGDK